MRANSQGWGHRLLGHIAEASEKGYRQSILAIAHMVTKWYEPKINAHVSLKHRSH